MEVRIKSVDSMKADYRGNGIVADLEFIDDEEVIKDFGAKACIDALDETEVYEVLGGWKNAKEFYAEEIAEMIEAAKG